MAAINPETAGRDAFMAFGNCAQASFEAAREANDLDGGPILAALTPFPGIGLRGETCGAVTGSLMAIGLVYGSARPGDRRRYLAAVAAAREFCARFEAVNGGTTCSRILEAKLGHPLDLADRADVAAYLEEGGPATCAEIVASAARIATALIAHRRLHAADGVSGSGPATRPKRTPC